MPDTLTWDRVPRSFRILARWITIAQAAGYGVSIAFARDTTSRFMSGDAVDTHALLQSAHSHLLGMTALFALSGVSFALCSSPDGRLKAAALRTPFAAILVAFTALWLMKSVPVLVWVLLASQLVMAVAFYFQTIVTLRELRRVRRTVDDRR